MKYTINKEKTIYYAAKNLTVGLTDLVLSVIKPDGSEITPVVNEQTNGLYKATYTPDQLGFYWERITSATNGDKVFNSFLVVGNDCDDLKVQYDTQNVKLASIEAKIDALNDNGGGYFA